MAVDWSKFTLIDDYNWDIRRGPDAITARYKVTASDFASYKPGIGDNGPAGSVASAYYVERCQAVAYASGYLIANVTFLSSLAPNRTSRASSSDLDADFQTDQDEGSIRMRPEWFWLKRRTFGNASAVDLSGIDSDLRDYTPDVYTSAGVQYSAADWNTVAQIPKSSPFSAIPDYDYVDHILPTTVAKLTFYKSASDPVNEDFKGVADGSAIPSDFDVPDRTTANVWRAVKQITRNVTTSNGSSYVKVVRWIEHVPVINDRDGSALRWDADRNGGAMTW